MVFDFSRIAVFACLHVGYDKQFRREFRIEDFRGFGTRTGGRALNEILRTITVASRTGLAATLLFLATARPTPAQIYDPALIAKARAIHDRVLKLDTHNDIDPANFTADCNYTMRLTTQVNLPKMIEGGMDVSFMIVYVGPGPVDAGRLRQRLPAGDREVRRHPST